MMMMISLLNKTHNMLLSYQAAKRGLDTIHEVAKQRRPETDIQRFIVFGASKVVNHFSPIFNNIDITCCNYCHIQGGWNIEG